MPLTGKLSSLKIARAAAPFEPVWAGPCSDTPNGGITFSLLSRFLVCRERFRLYAIRGLRTVDRFNHRLEYGSMWHACEEATANWPQGDRHFDYRNPPWLAALNSYCQGLLKKYPTQRAGVEKWYGVCRIQFPVYLDFWSRHPDVTDRTPLLSEQVFNVPYGLPSGRIVRLRGKWDSVGLVGRGVPGRNQQPGIWLQENKTKGDINERQIKQQLSFDLQTMIYLTALSQDTGVDGLEEVKGWQGPGKDFKAPILGVRYNVVRRPLSGGKGTIVQREATKGSKCQRCKGTGRVTNKGLVASPVSPCPKCLGVCRIGAKPAESEDEYYDRLAQYIKDEPEAYFMRWSVRVSNRDVQIFCKESLDPILETLVQWYDWVTTGACDTEVLAKNCHWRHPYGVYNPLDEGGSSDLDEYLITGSETGLQRTGNLFPELTCP